MTVKTFLTWGATRDEITGAWPGDELIPDSNTPDCTMAATLPAPPEQVWPWLAPQVPQPGGKPPPGLITIGENHDRPFMTSFLATGLVPPRTMITFGSVAGGGPGRACGRYRPGGCGPGGVLPASGTAASVLAPGGPALRDAGGRAGGFRPDIGECIGPKRARSRHFTCRSRWPAGTCGTPGTTPASRARGLGRAPGGVIAG